MHVFERYSNPLKSARLRQYLHEGAEGWYMPVVAEAVPSLVHVALFLFFLGLADSLLSLNTTVGVTTVIPISACGFLYVFSVFTPVIYPQAPFQNSFTGLIWSLAQKVHPRRYFHFDRASGGDHKAVSSTMSIGQVQLAMEENEKRKHRDARAVQWLIHNRTEDEEMESFVMAIPGTFASIWGVEVWRKVSEVKQSDDTNSGLNGQVRSQTNAGFPVSVLPRHVSPPPQRTSTPRGFRRIFGTPRVTGTPGNVKTFPAIPLAGDDPQGIMDPAIYDLCKRIRRLLDTCNNRNLLKKEVWRKRTRGCVETVASLVFCADVKLDEFGELGRLLLELGDVENIRDLSATGSNGSFITHWTCLSLVTVTRWSLNNDSVKRYADHAIDSLSKLELADGDVRTNIGDADEKAIENARTIDGYFETASGFYVHRLSGAFISNQEARTEEAVRNILAYDHEADVAMLERIAPAVNQMEPFDTSVSYLDKTIGIVARGLNAHIPGISFDEFRSPELIQPKEFFNLSATGKPLTPQFIFLRQRLELLCSFGPKLRDIMDGQGTGAYDAILESLKAVPNDVDGERPVMGQRHVMERQLWRLHDLRDGGGFGYSVERFFLVLAQLLPMAPSRDTYSTLYIGTFRAVASNWSQHKDSIGTQRVILNIICDMAIRFRGFFSDCDYPDYIIQELLVLLGNMMEGQSGSHIDKVVEELRSLSWRRNEQLADKAIEVISRSRLPVSSS